MHYNTEATIRHYVHFITLTLNETKLVHFFFYTKKIAELIHWSVCTRLSDWSECMRWHAPSSSLA